MLSGSNGYRSYILLLYLGFSLGRVAAQPSSFICLIGIYSLKVLLWHFLFYPCFYTVIYHIYMVIAGFTDFCHLDILLSSPYIGLLHMCVCRWFILASTKLCVFACFGLGMCETTLSLNLGTEGVQLIMEDLLIFPFTYIVNILLIDTSCFLLPPTPWVFSMVG